MCQHAQIEVLPEIVAAVQGRVEVYIDGGITLGTDVLKARNQFITAWLSAR